MPRNFTANSLAGKRPKRIIARETINLKRTKPQFAGKKWKFSAVAIEVAVKDSELSAASSKYYAQDQIQKHIQATTITKS